MCLVATGQETAGLQQKRQRQGDICTAGDCNELMWCGIANTPEDSPLLLCQYSAQGLPDVHMDS